MKRNACILLLSVIIFCLGTMLVACSSGEINLIYFVDGQEYGTATISVESPLTFPENPVKEGYTFEGWYLDDGVWEKPLTIDNLIAEESYDDKNVYAYFMVAHEHIYSPWVSNYDGTHTRTCVEDKTHKESEKCAYVDSINLPSASRSGRITHKCEKCGYTHYDKIYGVTFTGGSGTTGTAPKMDYKYAGDVIKMPSNPFTKDGYRFSGWEYGGNVYSSRNSFEMPDKSVVFSAKWTQRVTHEHTYASEWSSNEDYHWKASTCGHSYAEEKIAHDWDEGVITQEATADLTGIMTYTCTECGMEKEEIIPASDAYTVSFYDSDGTLLQESKVVVGTDATPPLSPEKDGYEFDKWDCSYTNVHSDLRVTATYVRVFIVKFLDYDGTIIDLQIIKEGETVKEVSDPSRAGYSFVSWDGTFDSVTDDITVNAVYVKRYKVSFLDYDNSVLKEVYTDEGTSVTPPEDPERVGYSFVGWSNETDYIVADTESKAEYSANTYKVVFKMPDNSVIDEQTLYYGNKADEPEKEDIYLNWYVMKGYYFSGWDKSFDEITENTTVNALYATEITTPILIVDAENAHQLGSGAYDNDVKIRVYLCGALPLYGLSLSITYDEKLSISGKEKIVNGSNFDSAAVQLNDTTKTVDWAWSNGTPMNVNDFVEILSLSFTVPRLGGKTCNIELDENSYLINSELKKETPIIISGYISEKA